MILLKSLKNKEGKLRKWNKKSVENHGMNEEIPFFYRNEIFEFFGEIISNRRFESFMIFTTIVSMIVIALESPILDPNSQTIQGLEILEYIFISIYTLEFLLKILIFGAFKGKKSYFQDSLYHLQKKSINNR